MASDPHLDAGGIAQRQFTTARRGYDADEVRSYLRELANVVAALQRAETEARTRLDEAEARARKAEQLDEHRLVEILGEETARVLDAARAASTDIRGKAEEAASRLISEANQEAHRVRAEGEAALVAQRAQLLAEVEKLRADAASELDRRRAEGAEIVAQMRREAQAECDTLRQQGEQKRLEAEMQAETIRAKAREEGRALIAEAQVVRERVLGDLARRRRTSREQLERLNAGRERLLAAYEVVRRTVDEATTELTVVLPEAKIAGDSALRRVKGEPEPSVEQLEDMVAMARITGLLEDSAAQGIDEEDYLADDAPPPVVVGAGAGAGAGAGLPVDAEAPAAQSDPVELYDIESESDADLVELEDEAETETDVETDATELVESEALEADGGDDVPAESEPGEEADEAVAAAEDEAEAADVAVAAATEADGAADHGERHVVEAGGLVDPVPVNGHDRPAATRVPAPEPAVPAAVALASDPATPVLSNFDRGGPELVVPADPAEAPAADLGAADDRRVNGHTHPAVEVDGDEDDDEDAGYTDDGYDEEDLDEGGWDDEHDEHDEAGATSSVDALFARLKADRDHPAEDEPEEQLDAAEPGRGIDEVDHDGHDDLDGHGVTARRPRVSSLAAMSDADILASAGYGDTGEDGYVYGPGDGDGADPTGEGDDGEYDGYGLPVTRPAVSALGDEADLGDLGDDEADGSDDGADFADMDPDEAMLRLRDDSLETVEHDLSRRLKRVLADEQNEVLDTLRRVKPASLDELLPGGPDVHVARYADAAVEGLSTAAVWGAASVDGEPSGSYEALAGELGRTVVEPLRERIARSFTESGGDVDDVTGRLRALYREWKSHHLTAAAQHFAVAAYARGAYEAVPDGTPVRWLVDRSGDPCPDADDNALADSVCKGQVFPTGDRCPPAHPGCRCMVVPLDWPRLG
jgi:DivIVA domain-containing protein